MPGGKNFAKTSGPFKEKAYEETKSVEKHNKISETIFGFVDNFIRRRPSAKLLAVEAHIKFIFNKTSKWLAGKKKKNWNLS